MRILITGGAGFIGSEVVRQYLSCTEHEVVNLDALTYAGNLDSLAAVENHPRYHFVHGDICSMNTVRQVLETHQPDAVMHLAAESHVDRSIDSPRQFIETNIVGTFNLLSASLEYWRSLADERARGFRFHHVSTDEVYGSLGAEGLFAEDTAYDPSSPYSASKASSDHLVRAWHRTFGLPVLVTNCSNNYGPYQFPEKLIPLMILNALEGKALPVYGKGENVRDWLYVGDHAAALRLVLERGACGETYNIGGHNEQRNIDVVEAICSVLDELHPEGSPHNRLISFVQDRPGHDLRYAIDSSRIQETLGWQPEESFASGIRRTALWYLENLEWCGRVQTGAYRRQRLGLVGQA